MTTNETKAHEDFVVLLDARKNSATVRDLLRVQRLVDDGHMTSAGIELQISTYRSLVEMHQAVTDLPVELAVETDGTTVTLVGAPGYVALALARFGFTD
jgi:hypothetical protein